MPLRMSLPDQMLRTHSTSFQLSAGSNWLLVHCASETTFSMPRTWPARLPKVLRLPRRIESAHAGLLPMSMRLASVIRGGTVREDFAVTVLHAAEADGSERERQPHRLPEDGGRKIALRDIHQHALAQLDAFQVLPIRAQGLLRIGTCLRVIEKGARHLAARLLPQVLDAGDRLQ